LPSFQHGVSGEATASSGYMDVAAEPDGDGFGGFEDGAYAELDAEETSTDPGYMDVAGVEDDDNSGASDSEDDV
jgi:hypothetical protein